ncbi:MAG: IMPACT family protein [Lachnospiraceae bacterium]|nr:IMPACT family protein [Lachnospiraceae bacterium]
MKPYRTPADNGIFGGELVEKKSRFIAAVKHTDTESEAAAFLASEKKKYYDAKHHCSAWVIVGENGAPDIVHSSDDGEPSGTAGRPILDCITGRGLKNICVVVTRYFGGTLLGTGGLVRAYSGAAVEALSGTEIVEMKPMLTIDVTFSYAGEPKVRRYLSDHGLNFKEPVYGADVTFPVLLEPESADGFEEELTNLLNGDVLFERGSVEFLGIPVIEEGT